MVEALNSSGESSEGDDPYVLHSLNLFLIDLGFFPLDTIEECYKFIAVQALKNNRVYKMLEEFVAMTI